MFNLDDLMEMFEGRERRKDSHAPTRSQHDKPVHAHHEDDEDDRGGHHNRHGHRHRREDDEDQSPFGRLFD